MSTILLAIVGLGSTELLIVGVVILLLFGHRLPSLMRSMGRGVVEFKRGVAGDDDEDDGERLDHVAGDSKKSQ